MKQHLKHLSAIARTTTMLLFFSVISSCSSFYQINYEFNRNFEIGDLAEAERLLRENKKAETGKARFVHYLNAGVVASLLGKHAESNQFFEKAYLIGEDYQKNYINIAASMLTNPNVVEYRGEDHEHLMLLYFKAMNFLVLGDRASALVECRRLNQRLFALSDRYQSSFNYREDAFAHLLMGIIFDAEQDYNNAFIAYRNSLRVYEDQYSSLFGTAVPEQLKRDVMRTAHIMGFREELAKLEDKFGFNYVHGSNAAGGELVMFWNNGLGPVKTEWSINFAVMPQGNGMVSFVNDNYGVNFPFRINESDDNNSLSNLKFFRVAFPKYVERPAMFTSAQLRQDGVSFPLQKTEDVNAIAFKLLEQRMIAEFSKSLLRFAIKKAAEQSLRSENESLGALLGMVNAATEKADTRNWQTLPHSIYYTRMPLKEGENIIEMQLTSGTSQTPQQGHTFKFEGQPGQTQFHVFHSLEVSPQYMSRGY